MWGCRGTGVPGAGPVGSGGNGGGCGEFGFVLGLLCPDDNT